MNNPANNLKMYKIYLEEQKNNLGNGYNNDRVKNYQKYMNLITGEINNWSAFDSEMKRIELNENAKINREIEENTRLAETGRVVRKLSPEEMNRLIHNSRDGKI